MGLGANGLLKFKLRISRFGVSPTALTFEDKSVIMPLSLWALWESRSLGDGEGC